MGFYLHNLQYALVVLVFIIVQIQTSEAWIWSLNQDEADKSTDIDTLDDIESAHSTHNKHAEVDGDVLEEEDVENEQNLRCSKHFNRNLYRILKSIMPEHLTNRTARQDDDTNTDPDDLVQSSLNLEASQIIGPVLRIVGSAAANNATAIDESYNSLPLAVRYEVTNFIKFAVDLLTTT